MRDSSGEIVEEPPDNCDYIVTLILRIFYVILRHIRLALELTMGLHCES